MLKKLSGLLMRSLVRAGKKQKRQVNSLLKALAPKLPKLAKAKRSPARKPASPAMPRAATQAAKKNAPRVKSAPAAAGPVAPGSWTRSIYIESGPAAARLHYFTYVPSYYAAQGDPRRPAGDAWPLIVMLHGCQQTAEEFAAGTRMNKLAEQKGYLVIYPQESLRRQAHRCWKWYDKSAQQGGAEAALIVKLVQYAAAKYKVDAGRIYLCGLSAGAAMAANIALNYPHVFAAAGLHSGPVFGTAGSPVAAYRAMQQGGGIKAGSAIADLLQRAPDLETMPAILIQGQSDRVVRPINQDQLAQQFLLVNRLAGANAIPRVSIVASRNTARSTQYAHTIHDYSRRRKQLLRVVRIPALQHAWSGGDAHFAFNSAPSPDASRMIVHFFARHRRSGA